MNRLIKLHFCELDIRKNIVIATINEGVHLSLELSEEMVIAVYNIIGDKPTVYISNRINSYSVDPILYTNLSKIENIIGFGIINFTSKKSRCSEVEKLFYNKRIQHFDNITTALLWAKKRLETEQPKIISQTVL